MIRQEKDSFNKLMDWMDKHTFILMVLYCLTGVIFFTSLAFVIWHFLEKFW